MEAYVLANEPRLRINLVTLALATLSRSVSGVALNNGGRVALAKWQKTEDQVRALATLIFGKPVKPGRLAGVNFDGLLELNELETIAIEVSEQKDLDKVRQGVTRLQLARQALSSEGVVLRGYIVLTREPTQAMLEAATAARVTVASISQFSALFFEFARYREARQAASFGSSIDPITGAIDMIDYVPVKYVDTDNARELTVEQIAESLIEGKRIVLLGEYGSGKSRCVRQIFDVLASKWDLSFQFPFAVNLRECWGLDRGDEIVRRGMFTLGLDELAGPAVRAQNRDSLIFLLDGFDEIGSQAWSTDEGKLRQLRAKALSGVKDLVLKSRAGCLVAGREHYFSSNEEMLSALGMPAKETLVIKAKDEFTEDELEAYFAASGIDVELPTWLPRRPLICQTIAQLTDDELGSMFGVSTGEVVFWNHFIKVVCERDARINAFFDADTIYHVFVALSRLTRKKPANMGPLSQRDLQDAFEAVVGQLPVEEAAVMLQRLPSLGRIGRESQDRQFVDMFILDGLRAKDVAGLVELDESKRRTAFDDAWNNPLGSLGQSILAADMNGKVERFISIAKRSSSLTNVVLGADIVSSLPEVGRGSIDVGGITLNGAAFSTLDLSQTQLNNLVIEDSTFESLILPNSPPIGSEIKRSLAARVTGASSYSGLPSWVQLESVDKFDSVQTVSEIRKAGLSPAHEVLVAVLKKIFKQRGGGRREDALTRGFGAGSARGLAPDVLGLLMRKGILDRHKGDDGWVYKAERSQAARVEKLLGELGSSRDEIWLGVAALNK